MDEFIYALDLSDELAEHNWKVLEKEFGITDDDIKFDDSDGSNE